MRRSVILLSVLFMLTGAVSAQVSVGIGLPGVSIGINVPVYPQLVRVPSYPVYYAPGLQSNFTTDRDRSMMLRQHLLQTISVHLSIRQQLHHKT